MPRHRMLSGAQHTYVTRAQTFKGRTCFHSMRISSLKPKWNTISWFKKRKRDRDRTAVIILYGRGKKKSIELAPNHNGSRHRGITTYFLLGALISLMYLHSAPWLEEPNSFRCVVCVVVHLSVAYTLFTSIPRNSSMNSGS